jgi:hypothetical protein
LKTVLKILLFFIITTLYVLPLHAQVVVEETITTDTVDIFAKSEKAGEGRRVPKLSMLMNLVLPGLGHQYLGENKRAMVYFSTEALLVFGMVFSESYSRKMYRNSKSYAWRYAGTSCTKDPEDEYWKIIGNKYYMSYMEFNDEMELINEMDMKYVEPDELWYWESEYYQENYREMRKTATSLHVVSSFFLGAMILNRVVSFMDARIASKYDTYQSSRNNVEILPYYSLNEGEVGVSISGNF